MFLNVLYFSAAWAFDLCQHAVQKEPCCFHVSAHMSHAIGLSFYDWLTVIHFRYKCLQKVHFKFILHKYSDMQANTCILQEYSFQRNSIIEVLMGNDHRRQVHWYEHAGTTLKIMILQRPSQLQPKIFKHLSFCQNNFLTKGFLYWNG